MSNLHLALENFLRDAAVTELMWNRFDELFVESKGVIQSCPSPFTSETEFMALLKHLTELPNVVRGNGGLYFDGILPDGSRFHMTLPPLSPHSGTLTVRKFTSHHRGLDNLVAAGFLTRKAATFLEYCMKARLNVLISGATGAGKTTLLNALASRIPLNERVITIEDIPEVQLSHPNWVRMLAVHEPEPVTIRDCLIGALRMRPDRIVVGECRSAEALEMLQAMNTGHDGGMTTLHANSTGDALTRLESLILFYAGAEIPLRALRRQIVDALDLVIHVRKGPKGERFVDEILELVGMEGEIITRLPLFKRTDGSRRLAATGHAPSFVQNFATYGVAIPKGFFDPNSFEDAA